MAAGCQDLVRQPRRFGGRDGSAKSGEGKDPTALALDGPHRRRQQPFVHQPVERPVQRAGIRADPAGRAPLDFEHDVVAMALTISERQENLECDGRQREERFGQFSGTLGHAGDKCYSL